MTWIQATALGEEPFVEFEQEFEYKGSVEEFTVPYTGLYQLEVWGGSSGNTYCNDSSHIGKGGYSQGYKVFEKGTILYICVGGKGSSGNADIGIFKPNHQYVNGGYNGGGGSRIQYNSDSWYGTVSGGGGATHIALVSGILSSIGYTSFVTNGNGLIVASGAGGWSHGAGNYGSGWGAGGNGGGFTGGEGGCNAGTIYSGKGGNQSSGGTTPPMASSCGGCSVGSFGQGGNAPSTSESLWGGVGGGGGLYGGSSGCVSGYYGTYSGGGGGSSYIDGVPEIEYKGATYTASTEGGVNSGNGKAKITRIA